MTFRCQHHKVKKTINFEFDRFDVIHKTKNGKIFVKSLKIYAKTLNCDRLTHQECAKY
jgi:hypothetical protein